jgi:hypothetical protein
MGQASIQCPCQKNPSRIYIEIHGVFHQGKDTGGNYPEHQNIIGLIEFLPENIPYHDYGDNLDGFF